MQDFRVDERKRQRECRRRHREAAAAAAGSATVPCHAPASASKAAECGDKLLAAWDTIVALSRATLQREIRVLVRTSPAFTGTSAATATALSRASLGR